MNDLLKAMQALEAASPENPVKLKICDGAGQHLDLLVTDATVDVTFSDEICHEEDEEIQVTIDTTYEKIE